MGKSPKTSIENNVNEKTWVVEGRREAKTVDAIKAALVDNEAGSLDPNRTSLNQPRAWELFSGQVQVQARPNGLCSHRPSIIEEEDVDTHQPTTHGPDRVARDGLGQRLEDRAQTEKGAVDEPGRFGRRQSLLISGGQDRCRGTIRGIIAVVREPCGASRMT